LLKTVLGLIWLGTTLFDIGGNKLRLIAVVQYRAQKLYIRAVLDHADYDQGHWRE
jgi:mRNA interferase HigB